MANIRIFYEHLVSNSLPSINDVTNYFSYSIKIYDLASKNIWKSCLWHDDEYRILQHLHISPWTKTGRKDTIISLIYCLWFSSLQAMCYTHFKNLETCWNFNRKRAALSPHANLSLLLTNWFPSQWTIPLRSFSAINSDAPFLLFTKYSHLVQRAGTCPW